MSRSKPWRVEVRTAGQNAEVTDYRSGAARDDAVRRAADAMRDGTSNAHTITVRWWDNNRGDWGLWDTIHRDKITPAAR